MRYKFVFEEKKKGWINFGMLAFLAFALLLSVFRQGLIGAVVFIMFSIWLLISCLRIEVEQ